MKRYRLYTEQKNSKWLHDKVGAYFNGYTVYTATGVWKGTKEPSLVFEIITAEPSAVQALQVIATGIKQLNNQEAVLVTTENIQSEVL